MATAAVGQYPASEGANNVPTSHPYTCNSCQVAFRSSDAQRTHMRSDWHRYNLKRRVASLPPLSSEIFAEKVLTAQASNSAATAKATFEKTCGPCQKTYFSENAFQNHIGSQKHRQREALLRKNGAVDETASVMSGTFSMGEPINGSTLETSKAPVAEEDFSDIVSGMKQTTIDHEDTRVKRQRRPSQSTTNEQQKSSANDAPADIEFHLSRCLFCNYDSPNLKNNVLHMGKFHGMFIPEQEYLVDLEGLLKYFHEKITENNECLYCHKLKTTAAAIQTHMKDKGHCMIAFETEDEMLEVGQFYDFTSTYSDDEDEGSGDENKNAKGGDADGWETDSSVSSLDSEELGSLPIDDHSHRYAKLSNHLHHSHRDPRPHRNVDGYHSRAHNYGHAAFVYDDELHLPSGRTAGHRSLAKYYRQNLRNYPTPDERLARQRAIESGEVDEDESDEAEKRSGRDTNKNRALVSRANGGLGMINVSDTKKQEVKAAETREIRRANKAQQQYQWGVDKRGNSQKHYRDHLLQ